MSDDVSFRDLGQCDIVVHLPFFMLEKNNYLSFASVVYLYNVAWAFDHFIDFILMG
jgi:hypothetical protein